MTRSSGRVTSPSAGVAGHILRALTGAARGHGGGRIRATPQRLPPIGPSRGVATQGRRGAVGS